MCKQMLKRAMLMVVGAVALAGALIADSGWFWQNPLPQGNTLNRFAVVDAGTTYAVGEAGTIVRSTDGGVNWEIQTSGARKYLYAIACTDANTCTVVGESGTILRTTNGGATWTAQSSGTQAFLYSVSFTDANTGMAAGADGSELAVILRTTNGGASWNTVKSRRTNVGYSVTCVNANVCVASGYEGILRTIDGGTTWTQQFYNPDVGVGQISCPDINTCMSLSFNYPTRQVLLLRTTNGGATWTQQSVDLYIGGIACTDANTCLALGSSPRPSVVRTTDGGATWTTLLTGESGIFGDVAFTDFNTGWVLGQGARILHTTDGGGTWVVQTPTSSVVTGSLSSVSCTDTNTCTAVGDPGIIVRTTDGGATWTAQSSGTANPLRGVSCPDADTCTAVGNPGTILRTTNGGATWTAQSSGATDRLGGISCSDASTCTAVGGKDDPSTPWGTSATILHTTNGGGTWTVQTPSGDPNDPVPELYSVSCVDPNSCTAVGAHFALTRTYDGGASWGDESLDTTETLWSVSMTDVDTGMAATDRGILRAAPAGTPWTRVAAEGALSISCTDANTCTAVGARDTILRTTDGGASWIHQPYPAASLRSVSCVDANTCTAVGPAATILRTNSGGQ